MLLANHLRDPGTLLKHSHETPKGLKDDIEEERKIEINAIEGGQCDELSQEIHPLKQAPFAGIMQIGADIGAFDEYLSFPRCCVIAFLKKTLDSGQIVNQNENWMEKKHNPVRVVRDIIYFFQDDKKND